MGDSIQLRVDADDQQLLAQVVNYYHRTLKNSQEALTFLSKRGITNGHAIDRFRIGYADRTLGLKLPCKQVKAGREIRARLEKLGLFRSTSGHEHFTGCVVFPVTAADGTQRIVDLYGRKTLGSRLLKRCSLDVNLPGERRGVWNIEAFGATEEIILCPSLLDALVFWNHGHRNVTCMFGGEALTEDHLSAFQEFNIKRILTPCEAICPRLLNAGLDCFLLRFPSGLDASTYGGHSEGAACEALGEVLRKAEWFGKGAETLRPILQPLSPDGSRSENAMDAIKLKSPSCDGQISAADPDTVGEFEEEKWEPRPKSLGKNIEPCSASPVPFAPQEPEVEVAQDEVVMTFGDRRYRVRGWRKNLAFDQLRVNVMASNKRGMFVDTFDLYAAKYRKTFISQAAADLVVEESTIKKDLGRLLLKLEELQDNNIEALISAKEVLPAMAEEDKAAALAMLRDPRLLDRIVADFQVVGEGTNKLVGYLAAVSRLLEQPLAVIVQSSSAAGKSTLMEAVLAFMPPEAQVKCSAMTAHSLFYMGETNLKHKIVAIVEEEGAKKVGFALKLLQSEGVLLIASTGKDSKTGRLVTKEYRVEGPVMIFLTATAIKFDEELLNRCLVLTVDENREQTRAIHKLQRQQQTVKGLLASLAHQDTLALHRNAQRLLRPLLVANPYAEDLTFLDDKTRTRRDHVKYLTLIRAITLLHQYQRPIKTIEHQGDVVEYIEVILEHIEVANQLAHDILGRSEDDLPTQTRRLLVLINEMVTAACREEAIDRFDYRFSRRSVRDRTGWGNTQLKVHLKRLEELEYLLVHRGARGKSFVYELLYEPRSDDSRRFLSRLIDVNQLRRNRVL